MARNKFIFFLLGSFLVLCYVLILDNFFCIFPYDAPVVFPVKYIYVSVEIAFERRGYIM